MSSQDGGSEQPSDEVEQGPPWTFAKIMWDSLPDDKKAELRKKRTESAGKSDQ